jgi:uncharacterized protein (UPF0332 family)
MNDQTEVYIAYRLKRVTESIDEIDMLIKMGHWNSVVNKMYYACFYAVGALFLRHELLTKSHSGTLHKFNEVFVKTGKISRDFAKLYAELFDKRQKADYNDNFDLDEQTIMRLYRPCIEFIKQIEALVNPTSPDNSGATFTLK